MDKQTKKTKNMKRKINIKIWQILDEPNWRFRVIIENGQTKTQHNVSMAKDFYNYLGLKLEAFQIVDSLIRLLIKDNNKLGNCFDIGNKFERKPEIKKKLISKIKSNWGEI